MLGSANWIDQVSSNPTFKDIAEPVKLGAQQSTVALVVTVALRVLATSLSWAFLGMSLGFLLTPVAIHLADKYAAGVGSRFSKALEDERTRLGTESIAKVAWATLGIGVLLGRWVPLLGILSGLAIAANGSLTMNRPHAAG